MSGVIQGTKHLNKKNNNEVINSNISNKVQILENEIIRLKSIIKEKDMTIEQLKLELNKSNKNIIKKGEDMTKLEMEMKKMDIEIKRLKIDLQVKINENKDNKRIKVIFKSPKINECVIESFENDNFIVLEEKFYVEYEEYKESHNLFLVDGGQPFQFKTLKENNIKDNSVIIIMENEID